MQFGQVIGKIVYGTTGYIAFFHNRDNLHFDRLCAVVAGVPGYNGRIWE